METMRLLSIGTWVLRVAAAVVLIQTLFFKFTGARESVYIFTALGAEPWGRIGSGLVELVAAALLLYSRTAVYGAALGLAVMSGAIFAHLTRLGITMPEVGDRGELFALAVITFTCCAVLLFFHRHELPFLGGFHRA